MAPEERGRFRSNIAVISALAIFCVAGFAITRNVTSKTIGIVDLASEHAAVTPKIKVERPRPRRSGDSVSRPSSLSSTSGKLVFSQGQGAFSILSVDGVGTSNTIGQLTYTFDNQPVFSPDGNKILFRSYRDGDIGSGVQDLYIMTSDGYDAIRLTNDGTFKPDSFSFSPDSSKIVYILNGNVWKVNADGSGNTLLADRPDYISEPVFSPDGSKIIFINGGTVWRMDADGSGALALSDFGGKERARYSPDGTKIIFSAGSDVYQINALDGSNEVMLFDHNTENYLLDKPEYSPDGTKILMECRHNGANICTANADGTGFAAIGGPILERQDPVWSPDSSTIAFIARNAATNIYGIYTSTTGGMPETVYLGSANNILRYLSWQFVCQAVPTPTPTPTPSLTPTPTPIPGLISEWNANDLTANDSTGQNNGQMVNAAFLDPGKRGLGFYFDGTGGYVEVLDSNSLDVQTGDFTLSTWFEPFGSAEHYVAARELVSAARISMSGLEPILSRLSTLATKAVVTELGLLLL
jgi:dipeptidyl aminopeptidase/acylaminoacyl peptidase